MTPFRLTALIILAISACAAAPGRSTVPPRHAAAPAKMRYKAVLVAGDGRLPVFDNAVDGVAARLRERGGVAPGGLQRLSAAPAVVARRGVRSASLDHVLDAIRAMRPGAGEGCFVLATSHRAPRPGRARGAAAALLPERRHVARGRPGAPGRGLALGEAGELLDPTALDRALASGCGDAPTVVIVSGCFSGNFAQAPMARANRVILTAARADRASFGCGAGRTYTVYDRCLLAALDGGGSWREAYGSVRRCVEGEERDGGFQRSHPQAYFGPAVAGLGLPS